VDDSVNLIDIYVGSPPDYGVYGLAHMVWVRVDFMDVHGAWAVGPSGEQPQVLNTEDRMDVNEDGIHPIPRTLLKEVPSSDCGSG
jgi:hypothetical protein